MSAPAIFLDRDGTLVEPRHYPSRPADLVLYDGVGPRLRRLQEAGFQLVVITNQSGIARGYFGEDDLARMHAHLRAELTLHGVRLDGIYHCPHHVDGVIPELAIACNCRKPRPGMLLRAAREHEIDVARAWFLGDILDDVEAGNRAGVSTILIDLGSEPAPPNRMRRPRFVARDTPHALDIVAAVEGIGPATSLTHQPSMWRTSAEVAVGGNR